MAAPDRQSKPSIARSEQDVQNWSFDEVYKVLATIPVGEYNSTLIRLQVDAAGNLKVSAARDTDRFGIQAISDDGTYKYFWFEDADLNYYIMRKTLATSVFTYTKGTGGYAAVYQSDVLGPSGSPTFASYGNTF